MLAVLRTGRDLIRVRLNNYFEATVERITVEDIVAVRQEPVSLDA